MVRPGILVHTEDFWDGVPVLSAATGAGRSYLAVRDIGQPASL